jgi:hypothetical protein
MSLRLPFCKPQPLASEQRRPDGALTEVGALVPLDRRVLSHRAFLKTLVAAIGGGAAAAVAAGAPRVEATYFAEGNPDRVDTTLKVEGNLYVVANPNDPTGKPGHVGIGTTAPAGTLDVYGDIRVNGTQVVGTDGVVKQSYYAP